MIKSKRVQIDTGSVIGVFDVMGEVPVGNWTVQLHCTNQSVTLCDSETATDRGYYLFTPVRIEVSDEEVWLRNHDGVNYGLVSILLIQGG